MGELSCEVGCEMLRDELRDDEALDEDEALDDDVREYVGGVGMLAGRPGRAADGRGTRRSAGEPWRNESCGDGSREGRLDGTRDVGWRDGGRAESGSRLPSGWAAGGRWPSCGSAK